MSRNEITHISGPCTSCDYYPVYSCPKYKTEWPNCCPNFPKEASSSFSRADKQMLWGELDKWHKSGKKCIFFGRWIPFLNQQDMKGFQGFRYVGRAE